MRRQISCGLTSCFAAALIVAGVLCLSATPAGAQLSGPCTGKGTQVQQGVTYDATTVNFVKIPRKGDVKWIGTTTASGKRVAVGEVDVKLPWPIGNVDIGDWGKTGVPTGSSGNSGTYHYDFSPLLAGIKVPVSGYDQEPGLPICKGDVVVELNGTSPIAWVSLAVTVFAVLGLSLAVRAKKVGP